MTHLYSNIELCHGNTYLVIEKHLFCFYMLVDVAYGVM